MFQQIWQQLKKFLVRLFGIHRRSASQPSSQQARERQQPPTLTDTEYEVLFSQLLEGVNQGWSRGEVAGFFIAKRINEAELAVWLRRFGERLLEAPEQHEEIARRIVLFGELRDGELGKVAQKIGRQILALIPPPPVSPITNNVWQGEVIEAVFVGNGLTIPQEKNRKEAEGSPENSDVN